MIKTKHKLIGIIVIAPSHYVPLSYSLRQKRVHEVIVTHYVHSFRHSK
jgi:hypothetical protein